MAQHRSDLAAALYLAERPTAAVTAYGIAAAQWERLPSGEPFGPYRTRWGRRLASLSTQLGPDHYRSAWDLGSELIIDNAVRHLHGISAS
ncbi:MAG: hypothetical protein OEV40_27265 [Acidimicrobiia bacterium]|nr:hypothetical protein [Acidimicrobiia bacterium]